MMIVLLASRLIGLAERRLGASFGFSCHALARALALVPVSSSRGKEKGKYKKPAAPVKAFSPYHDFGEIKYEHR
ncbi:MAG: hypothetical protein ACKOCD_02180 [Nitrospiraceae bacterium]